MADFLQAVGILEGAPDPKQFENQREITQQTSLLRNQMRSILSSVDFAIQGASLVGVPTTALESLKTEVSSAATSTTLSPAELEKKRATFEAEFDKIKGEQEKIIKDKQVADLQTAFDAIKKRNDEVVADTNTSEALKKRFADLLISAEYALKIIKAPVTEVPPDPTPLTVDQLQNQLATLNIDKQNEEEQEFSWSRFFKRLFYQTRLYFWYTFIVIGALLGGILASNLYVNDRFWLMRIYYFVYGATFFPLVMIYSLFKPPYIFSTLIPLFEKQNKDVFSIVDGLFSFERLDMLAADVKLGHTKMYARLLIIGYAVVYGAYFLLYYGLGAGWDALSNALRPAKAP